jgi:hypothetical protein
MPGHLDRLHDLFASSFFPDSFGPSLFLGFPKRLHYYGLC